MAERFGYDGYFERATACIGGGFNPSPYDDRDVAPTAARTSAEDEALIRVAIIEDNRPIREGLHFLINSTAGFQVTGAFASIEEARADIADGNPEVVLMDIGLPGMSGVDGIRVFKESHPAWLFLV